MCTLQSSHCWHIDFLIEIALFRWRKTNVWFRFGADRLSLRAGWHWKMRYSYSFFFCLASLLFYFFFFCSLCRRKWGRGEWALVDLTSSWPSPQLDHIRLTGRLESPSPTLVDPFHHFGFLFLLFYFIFYNTVGWMTRMSSIVRDSLDFFFFFKRKQNKKFPRILSFFFSHWEFVSPSKLGLASVFSPLHFFNIVYDGQEWRNMRRHSIYSAIFIHVFSRPIDSTKTIWMWGAWQYEMD